MYLGDTVLDERPSACVLLDIGIIATCRALKLPAQAWAFERLGTHRDLFDLPLEALTPPLSRRRSASQARFRALRIPASLIGHDAAREAGHPEAERVLREAR